MSEPHAFGQVIALGGVDAPSVDARRICDYPLAVSGCDEPSVGVLTTPCGDNPVWDEPFRGLFSQPCRIEPFTVFRDGVCDFEGLRRCDIVFVPGGNTVAALAVWRAYGVDELLRELWREGAILAGWSAGALCWFVAGLTDSLVPGQLRPFDDGLGLLAGSACPHFDTTERREAFARHVADGTLPAGIGIDEGAIVHFVGSELAAVLTTADGHTAHRVTRYGSAARIEPLAASAWD
jgi:peptidase E